MGGWIDDDLVGGARWLGDDVYGIADMSTGGQQQTNADGQTYSVLEHCEPRREEGREGRTELDWVGGEVSTLRGQLGRERPTLHSTPDGTHLRLERLLFGR